MTTFERKAQTFIDRIERALPGASGSRHASRAGRALATLERAADRLEAAKTAGRKPAAKSASKKR